MVEGSEAKILPSVRETVGRGYDAYVFRIHPKRIVVA